MRMVNCPYGRDCAQSALYEEEGALHALVRKLEQEQAQTALEVGLGSTAAKHTLVDALHLPLVQDITALLMRFSKCASQVYAADYCLYG